MCSHKTDYSLTWHVDCTPSMNIQWNWLSLPLTQIVTVTVGQHYRKRSLQKNKTLFLWQAQKDYTAAHFAAVGCSPVIITGPISKTVVHMGKYNLVENFPRYPITAGLLKIKKTEFVTYGFPYVLLKMHPRQLQGKWWGQRRKQWWYDWRNKIQPQIDLLK